MHIISAITRLFEQGGPVLFVIVMFAFLLFFIVIERILFLRFSYPAIAKRTIVEWEARIERQSWAASAIRERMVAQCQWLLKDHLSVIRVLVVISPMLGLLGTVTGMISVFDAMASSGSQIKLIADGVSRATIPTMAGMVVALIGLFSLFYLQRASSRECQLIDEQLTMDH